MEGQLTSTIHAIVFFVDGLMESRQGEVVMQDMNENVFKNVVDYFYCGKIEIDDTNVQDLVSISGLLQLRRIQEACCEFMKRQINTNNCLGMYKSNFYILIYTYMNIIIFGESRK